MDFSIGDERKAQDDKYFPQVNPKFQKVFRRRILDYDLSRSPIKIIKNAKGDLETMLSGLKEMLASRELYLIKLISEINNL